MWAATEAEAVAAGTGAAAAPTSTTVAAEASSPEAEAEGADSSRPMADTRADMRLQPYSVYTVFFFLKGKNCKKPLGPRAEINIYIYRIFATMISAKKLVFSIQEMLSRIKVSKALLRDPDSVGSLSPDPDQESGIQVQESKNSL
jgi:hypothetical protein